MRYFVMKGLYILFFTALATLAFADMDVPHPITEQQGQKYKITSKIGGMSSDELIKVKDGYLKELKHYRSVVDKMQENDQELLVALAAYDRERAKMTDVIYKLIKAYKIKGTLADEMRNHAERFKKIHDSHQGQLESLADYKSYDFQLGVTYAAFQQLLQSHPKVYEDWAKDVGDVKTPVGQYVAGLQDEYKKVEKAQAKVKEVQIVRQIEDSIEEINQELISRHAKR